MGIGMVELLLVVVVGGAMIVGGLACVGLLVYFLSNQQKTAQNNAPIQESKG
ncbi:MAG: hypothetical protein ACI9HK_005072 [Pirellulaceae bacterium]|jgi:hypothetical protein